MENNFPMLINGELKPGLRTDVIYRAMWDNDKLTWLKNSQLPPLHRPEKPTAGRGLASAFSGYVTVCPACRWWWREFSGAKQKLWPQWKVLFPRRNK